MHSRMLMALALIGSIGCTHLYDQSARVQALYDACNTPDAPGGFAAAVMKDGHVVFKGAYGLADSENGVPFTTRTVSDFASVAKQFTGLAVALLVRDGKLSLADDIRRHLPELPDFGETITIRHLLWHTSGIRDWVGLVKISGRDLEDVITDQFLTNLVMHQRDLNFRPGERFQYSNTGYFLLAKIVSRVTGRPFDEWMRENIFLPLDMKDTRIGSDYRAIIPHRASSYTKDENGRLRNSTSNLEACGSSSLFSTLDDMLKWAATYETRRIGGDEVWVMMLQKGVLNNGDPINYGFGIDVSDQGGVIKLGHGGSWGGYLSQVTCYPELHLAYVLMANRDPSGVYVDDKLVRLFRPDQPFRQSDGPAQPAQRTQVIVDPALLGEYAGTYAFFNKLATIEVSNDHLLARLPWGSADIYPESDRKFFRKDFDAQFEFLRNDDGNVDRLVYTFRGSPSRPFRRLDWDVSKDPDHGDVLGEYCSPELRTCYTLVVSNARLTLWHLHNEPVSLLRKDRDHYLGDTWWCEAIDIMRGPDGRVSGFTLKADGGNVQRLAFVKARPS